jgi:hypothetical protein
MDRGVVKVGMLADMVIVDQNPLQNFKVLYGNGAVRLNDETGRPSASAASSTRSRTASSTTRRSCWTTSRRWSRSRRQRKNSSYDGDDKSRRVTTG